MYGELKWLSGRTLRQAGLLSRATARNNCTKNIGLSKSSPDSTVYCRVAESRNILTTDIICYVKAKIAFNVASMFKPSTVLLRRSTVFDIMNYWKVYNSIEDQNKNWKNMLLSYRNLSTSNGSSYVFHSEEKLVIQFRESRSEVFNVEYFLHMQNM